MARDSEHSARLRKLIEFHGIEFWTIQEGRVKALALALKTMMSGEMRRTVALQAHRGLAGNVAEGKNAGGLSYRLHPTTQKRVSRLRPREEWIFADVARLRIVDDELWDRVKKRQAGLRSNRKGTSGTESGSAKRWPHHSRRPKYLLSGVLFCASCGGKLTIAGTGRKYYYCQRAKEEGPSACSGMIGLPQIEAENAILAGMKRDLMQPEAVEAFRAEYAAALATATDRVSEERTRLERQLRQIEKQIANATSLIMAGVNSQALIAELTKAEAEKTAVSARLEHLAKPQAELPADLNRRYAAIVRELEATLAKPELIMQGIDIMKTLVERVVVEEAPEGGHVLDLQDDLARMLTATAPERSSRTSACL